MAESISRAKIILPDQVLADHGTEFSSTEISVSDYHEYAGILLNYTKGAEASLLVRFEYAPETASGNWYMVGNVTGPGVNPFLSYTAELNATTKGCYQFAVAFPGTYRILVESSNSPGAGWGHVEIRSILKER